MILNEVEVILSSVVYSFAWVFIHFGVDNIFNKGIGGIERYNVHAREKKYLPEWCDYCWCFWTSAVLCTVLQVESHLILVPFVSSALTNVVLKAYYRR